MSTPSKQPYKNTKHSKSQQVSEWADGPQSNKKKKTSFATIKKKAEKVKAKFDKLVLITGYKNRQRTGNGESQRTKVEAGRINFFRELRYGGDRSRHTIGLGPETGIP